MTNLRAQHLKRSLLTSVAGLASLLAANPAFAQDAPAAPAPAPAAAPVPVAIDTDQIVITGTRRTDRTVTNSASPIDVISSSRTRRPADREHARLVKNFVPSFFVGQNTISDASSFVRAPSLRGLSADEMLVQINGKRFNRSALVQVYVGGDTALSFGSQGADISAIPSIAIKNLQVLRDGATAQYGSDAIAGVMNFGLRNDREGSSCRPAMASISITAIPSSTMALAARSRARPGSASARRASSMLPANGSRTAARAVARPARLRSSSRSSTRILPISCPTIRCRCKSGAARRSTAGKRCSTAASTSPRTASST